MSHIGKNIRKLRTVKKLSQAAFAELFGLARPSVGAYEEGRSEPKMETLVLIAQHFGLSIDLLLTKELTVNELYHFDVFQAAIPVAGTAPTPPATPAATPLTPFVPRLRELEYIVRHHDPAFVAALPTLQFPAQATETTRAFEVSGGAMLRHRQGLRPLDTVLCRRPGPGQPGLELGSAASLQPGRIYALVLPAEILIRRLTALSADRQTLQLTADNPDYGSQDVARGQVLEIWEVTGVFSTHLPVPALLDERVAELERQLRAVQERLGGLR